MVLTILLMKLRLCKKSKQKLSNFDIKCYFFRGMVGLLPGLAGKTFIVQVNTFLFFSIE